jgi:hypothetical protein
LAIAESGFEEEKRLLMLSPCSAAPQRAIPRAAVAARPVEKRADSAHDPAPLHGGHESGDEMKIHAPSETIFWIAVALLVLALVGQFVPDMGFLNQYDFWLSVSASLVLLLGCVV